jgi:hypothetical protein
VQSAMAMPAKTFFSMCNSMMRLEPQETLIAAHAHRIARMDGKDAEKAVNQLEKSARGLHGIIEEIRNIPR